MRAINNRAMVLLLVALGSYGGAVSEPRKMKQINIRLWEDNIEKAKEIAKETGEGYQVVLRRLVDQQLGDKKKTGKVR